MTKHPPAPQVSGLPPRPHPAHPPTHKEYAYARARAPHTALPPVPLHPHPAGKAPAHVQHLPTCWSCKVQVKAGRGVATGSSSEGAAAASVAEPSAGSAAGQAKSASNGGGSSSSTTTVELRTNVANLDDGGAAWLSNRESWWREAVSPGGWEPGWWWETVIHGGGKPGWWWTVSHGGGRPGWWWKTVNHGGGQPGFWPGPNN